MALWSKKSKRDGGSTSNGAGSAKPDAASRIAAADAPATPVASQSVKGTKNDPAEPGLSPEQQRKAAVASKRLAAAFGEIIAVLMRSKRHRAFSLADIEELVVPAVLTRQYALAEARSKSKGMTAPVAVVLWGSVSAEVDRRLSVEPDQPIKLAPKEWKSGDIVWVVEAIGEPRIVQAVLKRLYDQTWAGKTVKLRVRDKDGKSQVGALRAAAPL